MEISLYNLFSKLYRVESVENWSKVKIVICAPSACLFRCKDSHLVQMQYDQMAHLHNFDDSTAMLFPIQGLILKSKRFDQVKEGLKLNCK
uniref:Uncharacterized protein n=1 Tax=Romanomermis culicivorax TaxID=13658 RepID=A0A915HRT8_ROMCU